MAKKTGYREITGTIKLKSGMRIGGSDDLLQIGGTDMTCIKHPVTFEPYIPGSSIKGKMRSELEMALGKFGGRNNNEPCGCGRDDCLICRIFGPHKNTQHTLGPTRIIIRDAQLQVDEEGKGGETELKAENVIDRGTGTALHPRKLERVVAGSKFLLRLGIQIWDRDSGCSYNSSTGGDALVEFVKQGLRLVQRTGLGSGISKGSGEIEFVDLKVDGQSLTL